MNQKQGKVNLSTFLPQRSNRGASLPKEAIWLIIRFILFENFPWRWCKLKCWVLRCFGAKVGKGVVIKPSVKIVFPWKLQIGDYVWLGEEAWLINFEPITIESNCCVSQRAMLCTGNHDYTSPSFDGKDRPIYLEQGCWIASNAWVGPGVRVGSHAVLTAGSVASHDLEPYGIYQGNPAICIRTRHIR
jgi:putative colanic acid biosynthesis acetyltransferase WcaF